MLSEKILCVLIIIFSPVHSLFPPAKPTVSPLVKLVEISNAFATRIYRNLAWDDNNLFISPFTISSTLMALLEGARGKTSMELNHTLGFAENKLYKERFIDAYTELSSKIKLREIGQAVSVSNCLFLQEDFSLNQTYESLADRIFKLEIKELDYRRNEDSAVSSINEWFWRTAGRSFRNLTTVAGALVNMIVASSVSFRSSWSAMSSENFTDVLKPFYNNGVEDNVATVLMAERKDARLLLADSYDFRALDLPLGISNFSIWILLPHRKDGLVEVEDSLSTKLFQEVAASFREVQVDVALPKLSIEYDVDVSKVLQKMGIKSAFIENSANFHEITATKGLALSKVIHKGIVEIDVEKRVKDSILSSKAEKDFLGFFFSSYRSARRRLETTTHSPEPEEEKDSEMNPIQIDETKIGTQPRKSYPKVYPFIADHPFIFCLMEKSTGLVHSVGRVLRF